ncbi:MAG: hypothetical protein OEY51_12530 [Cyclobacteriaceae bacterium]|nr:hypothetical protein [Cyclobacteriaceae bacterium]
MDYLRSMSLSLCLISSLFLVIGFYRPWAMLWWEDTQNRLKILKVYGTSALIFFVTYLILEYIL